MRRSLETAAHVYTFYQYLILILYCHNPTHNSYHQNQFMLELYNFGYVALYFNCIAFIKVRIHFT
ncbi:hypothetical protein BGY98DRAFT_990080 [Russula aff. rugulosa BPL654]|nr:hypothetical protein BGY98DRAFT_990080 [Russula aff. rugulosa BPL654]